MPEEENFAQPPFPQDFAPFAPRIRRDAPSPVNSAAAPKEHEHEGGEAPKDDLQAEETFWHKHHYYPVYHYPVYHYPTYYYPTYYHRPYYW